MKKQSNIYVTINKNVVNFKVRIPWYWCQGIGLSKDKRDISILYENGELVIKQKNKIFFTDLSIEEKKGQIHKYKELFRENFYKQKDFVEAIGEYFKITYRTVYRLLENKPINNDLNNIELLERENRYNRNVKVMMSGNKTVRATITIPSSLAILFLKGNTCEELGIKNISELFPRNTSLPINMEFADNYVILKRNLSSI